MNVKCPYCLCSYNIDVDSLPKPIGDAKLGYGWWLRCCRCHKKWWLKNLLAQVHSNSPIKADISSKIDRLSKLKKQKHTEKTRVKIWKAVKYFLIVGVIGIVSLGIYNREFFTEYIKQKIERLSSNMVFKLRMLDVQYALKTDSENDVILTVSGKIINEDRNVIKLNGAKITVYDKDDNEIASWVGNIGSGYIISGETLDFTTEHKINKAIDDIRVDVSIM